MVSVPAWMENLDDEDFTFIKNFLLSSGSLKDVAKLYGVSYPTVRLRLDRLIQKIQLSTQSENDPFILLVQKMAIQEKIGLETAKTLLSAYREQRKRE